MGSASIRSRVRLAIAALGTVFVALLVLVLWTGLQTQKHMAIASGSLFPATLSSQEAASTFQKLTKSYSDAVLTEDKNGIDRADESAQAVLSALHSVQQNLTFSPQRQQQVSDLIDRFTDLSARSKVAYTAMIESKGNIPERTQASVAALAQDNQRMEASLRELRSRLSQDFQEQLDSVSAASKVQRVFGLVLFVLLACCGVVFTVLVERRVSRPLQQLITRCKEIAGDLTGSDERITAGDEIAELAHSFDALVSHLQEMAAISEAIARGDLSCEVQARSEHDALGHALARMKDGLGGLVRGVRDSAAQVASGSAQVAQASDESAKVSEQSSSAIDEVSSTMHEMTVNVQNVVKHTNAQASSVSETSASINQMVASIQRVANTSKLLLQISERSRLEVQSGIESMQKATDGLNRINSSIQSSSGIIDVLGQRADDIGKIIEVIDDIAEQTNLLALNAAIEAARAGEHGLGFAVVAEEVRKLAERSAQSTKEISELIQSIQKEARKAVENMTKSTGIVNEGLTLGAELESALKKISNVVTEVYRFAEEIGGATTEQSHGSTQIASATARLNEITMEITSSVEEQASGTQAVVRAMERMRALVQRSTSGATELAASADQMSKMSRNLLGLMDRFKLESMAVLGHESTIRSLQVAAAAATRA